MVRCPQMSEMALGQFEDACGPELSECLSHGSMRPGVNGGHIGGSGAWGLVGKVWRFHGQLAFEYIGT